MNQLLYDDLMRDIDLWYERAKEQRNRADRAEIALAFWKPIGISSILLVVLSVIKSVVLDSR